MRTVRGRIWSLAASTTPGATDNGFCFRMRRTLGACQRRRRCALANRSMVVSRSRARLRRGRCLVPQIEKPIRGEVVSELEHLRVIAPELLTHAAGQQSAFLLQLVGHPRHP